MNKKQLKQYIEKYILPNETKENIMLYYNGELEYDKEYIKEHQESNTLSHFSFDSEGNNVII